jgi:hypothetical protein
LGQLVEATLEDSDAALDDGRVFDQYTITARPGERVVVTVRSRVFDAFVDWGRLGAEGFESDMTDDDGAGDTDARLEIVIPADGTYVLRAHALERGQSGAYTIQVERRTK